MDKDIINGRRVAFQLIKEFNLIDYNKVLELLQSSEIQLRKDALKVISYNKSIYSPTDYSLMKKFIPIIKDGFPLLTTPAVIKGLLTSEKEAWLCSCGKKNEIIYDICEACHNDKFGFAKTDTQPSKCLFVIESRLKAIEEIRKVEKPSKILE